MDYVFEVGKRFGNIPFYISNTEIKKILGKPDSFNKETGVECCIYDFNYIAYGLDISFIHFDNFDDDIQIQTDKIIFNNKNLYFLKKDKIITLIEKEYEERNLEYKFEYETLEFSDAENQEEYNFEQIGLTLWFTKNKLDNVSVSKPLID